MFLILTMATMAGVSDGTFSDIVDKDLKELRNARWKKAFKVEDLGNRSESEQDSVNRKATIVIEHLIQASDVAHTMQHVSRAVKSSMSVGHSNTNPALSSSYSAIDTVEHLSQMGKYIESNDNRPPHHT